MISKIFFLLMLGSAFLNICPQDTPIKDGITTVGPCKARLDNGSTIDLCK